MGGARRTGRRAGLALLLACLSGTACGGGGSDAEPAIERERFVAAYADLRRAALEAGGGPLEPAERERILREHGLSEEDLLRFVDAHGSDPTYMRAVWDDVQLRLEPPETLPDSAPSASG